MTAPNYDTDLTDFEDFEAASTISTEMSGYTATAKGEDEDSDFPIQGTQHASAEQRTAALGSLASDYGSNITWTSGWNFFLWGIFLAPAAVNTDANGGIVMFVGSAITAHHRWTVGGSDFGRYPYGGWTNFVVDPEVTTGRTTTGTPGTNYRWVGMGCNVISAITKGSPYGIDVIRYGRGEVEVTYGEATDYATFDGMATENDSSTNRWGLFSLQAGSYLWKGLMTLGITGTIVDFRDSNRNIVIDNSRNVQSDFNRIEINNASSNIEWTNIIITSLCSVSPGEFEVIDDADVEFNLCQFTDMSTFVFLTNSIINTTTFRRCDLVEQGGGTFDGCSFEESVATVAFLVDDPDLITDCSFISDGTGHAIELTSDCAGNSYTLEDVVVSGYASTGTPGSTGNEVIYNNSGGAVTINIDGGSPASAFTYRNGTGASTTVTANYTFTITGLEQNTEVTIVTADTTTVLYHLENATVSDGDGKYKAEYTHSGGGSVDVLIHHVSYKPDISNILGITLPSTNSSAKVSMFEDENYFNPT